MIGLGCAHQILASDVHLFAVLQELGVVLQRQQDSPAAPAELVAWIWLSVKPPGGMVSRQDCASPRGLSESNTGKNQLNTTLGPKSESQVHTLWCGEAATKALEGTNRASLLVDAVDHVHGVKMVDAWERLESVGENKMVGNHPIPRIKLEMTGQHNFETCEILRRSSTTYSDLVHDRNASSLGLLV